MRIGAWLSITTAVVTIMGSMACATVPAFKIPDRVHDVAVLLFMSGQCQLSTTPFLRVRRGDRINFHLVNVDSKCTSDALDIDDSQWKDKENRPVKPPLDRLGDSPPNGKSFRARPDQKGAFKYTLKMGSVILDPEIQIEK